MVKFDISFKYTEKNVIPKGCRKPRDLLHLDGFAQVEITEIAAPVAIIEQAKEYVAGDRVAFQRRYRWYNDRLWVPWWPNSGIGQVTLSAIDVLHYTLADRIGHGWRTMAEAEKVIADFAANLVFIDGIAHEPVAEPLLRVVTFHYQGRHSVWVSVEQPKPNGPLEDFYRVDQYADAIAEANRIADRMRAAYGEAFDGSTVDSPWDGQTKLVEVLMPQVLRRDPQAEAVIAKAAAHRLKITKAVLAATTHIEEAIRSLATATELIGDDEEFRPLSSTLSVALTSLQQSPRAEIERTNQE